MKSSADNSTIMIVDDDEDLLQTMKAILELEEYNVIVIKTAEECMDELNSKEIDLVLLDLKLPGVDDFDVLNQIKNQHPGKQVVIITGYGTYEYAVTATKMGAYDFLSKPVEPERLLVTVKNALEQRLLIKEKIRSLEENRIRYRMVGESPALKNIYELIDRVADSNLRVVIQGDSGTGKELVARAIHFNSSRSGLPFHSLNCAAIPEDLIESELFGHLKGSFTNAFTDKKGAFAIADKSTLFLDEIADLSLRAQAKVLRAIETGEILPLGAEKAISVDVRIITATNKNLEEKIDSGEFREDLYHRINVVRIYIPPLCERPDDISPIAMHFIRQICEDNNVKLRRLTEEAISILKYQAWKGNARELKNVMERLIFLTDSELITGKSVLTVLHLHEFNYRQFAALDLKSARENFERLFITDKLIFYSWNVAATAEAIGVERTHLYRKMKHLNIKKDNTGKFTQ
ncbi:MAG: sigma-54 dependent transcriptional regulator [candidate division KSB1 bacterium]|nr:sigma-54 dependent transcriptional regulator [candidate division KSB1 bacterium]